MSSSKKPKMPVTDYYLSLHYGVCHGPVDALLGVYVGEKPALETRLTEQVAVPINNRNLFGGVKKEGGVQGNMSYLPGFPDQFMPSDLAQKLGRTTDTCPAYRGLTSLFFYGSPGRGFYWSSNTPYLKSIWAKVTRVPNTWYPERAAIGKGELTRRAVYIAVDKSGSMEGERMEATKIALNSVIDRIQGAVTALGLDLDLGMNFWSNNQVNRTYDSVQVNDLDNLRTFVDGIVANGGTDFNQAVNHAASWFASKAGDSTISERVFIFVTDGAPEPIESAAQAAATAAGMAGVNRYGINIFQSDTSYTALLDNTPDDGVPVVTSGDSSGLVLAVEKALFPDDDAPDCNPAHMIFECLTNTDWGMGSPRSGIDLAALRRGADTLFSEQFGLSMMWSQQATIEKFISEILDHIEGTLFVDPRTGLITLKLIRNDYNPDDLFVLDADNCEVSNFQRKSPGEIINEINVTWTNPENEQEESVTFQDLAGISIQGGIVSSGRNYYGVRSRELAMRLAARDIATASAPLASCDVEVDRSAWSFTPGSVVKLRYPEHGIEEIVMRIGKVDYGRPGSPTVKASLVEDIFSLPVPHYEEPVGGEWTDPTEEPRSVDYTQVITLPFYMTAQFVDASITLAAEYPDVWAGVLVGQEGRDTSEFELVGQVSGPSGALAWENLGTRTISSRATLVDALSPQATSQVRQFTDATQGAGPTIDGFMIIGGADEDQEIVLITGYDDPYYNVERGVMDTVPRAWPAGTPVWFVNLSARIQDNETRSAFETVQYKALPQTSLGILPEGAAPTFSGQLTERPHLPLRPANVKVEDVGFGVYDASDPGITEFEVTWAIRNRLMEDSTILAWTDAGVSGEAGQSTTITITDVETGAVVVEYDALSGESHTVPVADLGSSSAVRVRVTSQRDGMDSLQGHSIIVLLASGYGFNYGLDYGN